MQDLQERKHIAPIVLCNGIAAPQTGLDERQGRMELNGFR